MRRGCDNRVSTIEDCYLFILANQGGFPEGFGYDLIQEKNGMSNCGTNTIDNPVWEKTNMIEAVYVQPCRVNNMNAQMLTGSKKYFYTSLSSYPDDRLYSSPTMRALCEMIRA
jgi:hypothetical protein